MLVGLSFQNAFQDVSSSLLCAFTILMMIVPLKISFARIQSFHIYEQVIYYQHYLFYVPIYILWE